MKNGLIVRKLLGGSVMNLCELVFDILDLLVLVQEIGLKMAHFMNTS